MKKLIDVHTHTLSSGHAYSTLRENIAVAKEKGLQYYGLSEHAKQMPGTVHEFYFTNMRVLPRIIDGVTILRGIEANILNVEGEIDVDDHALPTLDYVIASIHSPCFGPSQSKELNTLAYENACKNPIVKIIGHPDDGRYPCDYEKLVDCCKATDTLIEINNSSLVNDGYRENCWENSREILRLCKEKKHHIIMNSDAHVCFDVGNFSLAEKLLEECDFPKELVVNYSLELIDHYFLAKVNKEIDKNKEVE